VLPLNEARQALGYTLTFKGVDKPTPAARDAMLVEVKDGDGAAYIARPLMYRNEKSNQLVANPDVRARLTHDLYVSPIEFDPGQPPEGSELDLGKGESKPAGTAEVTFDGFDMAQTHTEGGEISIGARLTVTRDGASETVTPVLRSGAGGFAATPQAVSSLPGVTVQLIGVNASQGRVRLRLNGLGGGAAARANLRPGESLTYKDATLTFDGFDLSDFDPQAGRIHLGAVFTVRKYGQADAEIIPRYLGGTGREEHVDAQIPGLTGASLRIGKMNAEEKMVEVLVLDAQAAADAGQPMRFSIDFSVKPMIGLLWAGLVILLAGGVMAMVRRGEEFAGAAGGPAQTG
jgi:cytochrome c-type biogenesis protein CcmF